MNYGIETVTTDKGNEFFGYKENLETGKRTYVCHAYTEEVCNQMLEIE